MIGIIDYGMGNLFSLAGALNRLGYDYTFVSDKEGIKKCSALILPGVGAFRDAIKNLDSKKITGFILEWADKNKPLLGICLGMQLLFAESHEFGCYKGLGILEGSVVKIPPQVKVPHMGWNRLTVNYDHEIFRGFSEGYVYFVHSYYASTKNEYILAETSYGIKIPAIVSKENVLGMQFHPEKSGEVGLELLKNWLKTVKENT